MLYHAEFVLLLEQESLTVQRKKIRKFRYCTKQFTGDRPRLVFAHP